MKNARIEFTFGTGFRKDGNEINEPDKKIALQRICQKTAELFNGYTPLQGQGGWINPRGGLVEEPCGTLIVYEFNNEFATTEFAISTIRDLIKSQLQQEAVCIIKIPCSFSIQ